MFVGALNADTVETLAIGLLLASVIAAVLVIRSSLKLASKLLFAVALVGLGVAIFQNRVELGRCSQTCACAIYGHDVEVPHLPFSCNY